MRDEKLVKMETQIAKIVDLHILWVEEADWVTGELVDSSNELDLAIIPEVDVVRGILRVKSWRNNQNQVAFSDHLNDFHATFDAPLHTK